jgi:hypothetical protein
MINSTLKQPTMVVEAMVVALMMMPRLRLAAAPAALQPGAEPGALVGQLLLYELQVDVLVGDGSARAEWDCCGTGNA